MFLHNNVVIFLDALTSKDILWHFDMNIYKNVRKNLRFTFYEKQFAMYKYSENSFSNIKTYFL